MKISTALNHKSRLLYYLNDVYSRAERFCWNHDRLIQEIKEKIYDDPAYKKVPYWVRSFISGYSDCLWANYWKLVKWVLPFEGVNYDGWNNLPEEGKEFYRQNKGQGKYIYIKDPSKDYT